MKTGGRPPRRARTDRPRRTSSSTGSRSPTAAFSEARTRSRTARRARRRRARARRPTRGLPRCPDSPNHGRSSSGIFVNALLSRARLRSRSSRSLPSRRTRNRRRRKRTSFVHIGSTYDRRCAGSSPWWRPRLGPSQGSRRPRPRRRDFRDASRRARRRSRRTRSVRRRELLPHASKSRPPGRPRGGTRATPDAATRGDERVASRTRDPPRASRARRDARNRTGRRRRPRWGASTCSGARGARGRVWGGRSPRQPPEKAPEEKKRLFVFSSTADS